MVKPDEVLAEVDEQSQEYNLGKILHLSPLNLREFLLVSPGRPVRKNDLLWEKKTLFGKKVFRSPIDGLLSELSPEGFLRIITQPPKTILAPVGGKVLKTETQEIVLEFPGVVLECPSGSGPAKWGEMEIIEKEEADLSDLSLSCRGKILAVRGIISAGFFNKAEALGASGIIGAALAGSVKPSDLPILFWKKEDLIPTSFWDTLKKYNGTRAQISGAEKVLRIAV